MTGEKIDATTQIFGLAFEVDDLSRRDAYHAEMVKQFGLLMDKTRQSGARMVSVAVTIEGGEPIAT